jgi:hypothetical protein
MQISPDLYPPSTINRQQQLTPASSVSDDESTPKRYRPRSISDPHHDDYYFYHTGRRMTDRRGSVHDVGKRNDEERKSQSQVRLPPISSLLAAVERMFFFKSPSLCMTDAFSDASTSSTTAAGCDTTRTIKRTYSTGIKRAYLFVSPP